MDRNCQAAIICGLTVLSINCSLGATIGIGGVETSRMNYKPIQRRNSSVLSTHIRMFFSEITPEAQTHWGDWGVAEFCPEDSFARDFELKIEPSNAAGDTAMNAIKLYCYYNISGVELEAGQETSTEGKWGAWTGKVSCGDKGAFLKGARFKSEPDQGLSDDTAGNSVNMECTDGIILEPEGGPWGEWSDWVMCPENTAVCGVKTKVEPDVPVDDTALNGLTFYCCEL